MALSVSGFPEPSRHPGASNEAFTSVDDGHNKASLMGSPRLRGLFGASGSSSSGPTRKSPSTANKSDTESDGLNLNTTPPTTPSLSFSKFEPLSQQEYELELQLPAAGPSNKPPTRVPTTKRAQLPPVPRTRTAASPVRLGPSLARLDIGAGTRSPPPSHSLPKPVPPPSVVVEEWGSTPTPTIHQPRPLPSVPGPLPPPQPIAGPSRLANSATPPIAGPSRHANAIAGSSKHVNAVAGSSKQPQAIASPSSSSPSSSSTAPVAAPPTPASKVLITHQPSPQQPRTHRQNSPSLSMRRYQPLVADPSPSSSSDSIGQTSNANVSSAVRPLPRIPPPGGSAPSSSATVTLTASAGVKPSSSSSSSSAAPNTSRFITPPAKVKRPKTSPSAISGFSPPTGSTPSGPARSAFENIPSSWATRPVLLNAQRPISPPATTHSRPLPLKAPRARSHSRPRRDRSLDSYHSRPSVSTSRTTGPSAPSSARATTTTFSRPPRSLPSPTITGARPLPTRSTTTDSVLTHSKTLNIQTSITSPISSASNATFSPNGRRLPPSPPTGPVPRIKSPVSSPSPITIIPPPRPPSVPLPTISRSPAPPRLSQPVKPKASQPIIAVKTDFKADLSGDDITPSTEHPMHAHPVDAFKDSDSLLHPTISPIDPPSESPLEFFVDDESGHLNLSRSPSPIRYARPDSRGNLSDSEEEVEFASASDSASSRGVSPIAATRKRTLLRSYRNSYRPRAGRSSPPPIPFRQRSPSPLLEEPEREAEKEKDKKQKEKEKKAKKKTPRSYFGGDGGGPFANGSASGSAPGTRASSPERKSRSRQPRRLAEAVSMALEEVRYRGRAGSGAGIPGGAPPLSAPIPVSATTSEDLEVLDISMQSMSRRGTFATAGTGGSSSSISTRSSLGVAWAQTVETAKSRRAVELADTSSTGSASGSGSAAHGIESEEPPFMWVSSSKPPVPAAPFIPTPPPQLLQQHRRVNSYGRQDHLLPPNGSDQHGQSDGDVEKTGMACGLPLGTKPRAPESMTTTITSTVSVSRPPSGASSSFSFGMGRNSAKSKKKRTRTISETQPVTTSTVISDDSYAANNSDRDGVLPMPMPLQRDNSDSWVDVEARKEALVGEENGEVVVVTTRRVMRSIDHGGDVFEHEQETGLADVIPHLRNLKLSRG